MNQPIGTKDRPLSGRMTVQNSESSSAITVGTPVSFDPTNITANKVLLPSSLAAATAPTFFAGFCLAASAAAGAFFEVAYKGYVASAKYVIRTRAASTDSYSTVAALAAGSYCTIDTVNNAIATSGAGAAHFAAPMIVLVGTVASKAGVASNTDDASTVSTGTIAVWVRAL